MPPTTPAAVCGTGAARLGPPTAAELMQVSAQVKAAPYVPAGTNHGNNFAYGTGGKGRGTMRSMWSLTGVVARPAPKLTVDATTPTADAITILSQRKRLCP